MEGLINDSNMRSEQSSFWQFSDQLRLQTDNFSGLSLGDSIWSDGNHTSFSSKPAVEDRRNVDVVNPDWKSSFLPQKLAFGNSNNLDRYNTLNTIETGYSKNNTGIANKNNNNNISSNDFNYNNNNNFNGEIKNYFNKAVTKPIGNGFANSKKNHSNNEGNGKKKNGNNNNYNNGNNNSAVDKRFKTLPPSEALPRDEAIGGYIFVCNNDTMEENLRRQLFGMSKCLFNFINYNSIFTHQERNQRKKIYQLG